MTARRRTGKPGIRTGTAIPARSVGARRIPAPRFAPKTNARRFQGDQAGERTPLFRDKGNHE
jgi:hypothetical protein